jgi:hypothetical protein
VKYLKLFGVFLLLAKDTGMISGNKLVMKPNTVLVGGLDHAGNPTVAPFQDGARVEVGDADSTIISNKVNRNTSLIESSSFIISASPTSTRAPS